MGIFGCVVNNCDKMQPKKLVELGRVVHIATGPCAGEIGAIVDIIDAKRMLVDGPRIPRREIKLKDMFLTRIMLKYNEVPSQKALLAMWEGAHVDLRYKKTEHAKRIDKMARRAACTDFEFFKVRVAARCANKIKENALIQLHAKHPRAVSKMERKRRVDMGVALGYRTVKTLTPEEKVAKTEKEKALRSARKAKTVEYMKAKKDKRPKRKTKAPKAPRVSAVKAFRTQRDATRKAEASFRKEHTKALQVNRAERKAALAAKTKPPRKLKAKVIKPKRSTVRKAL